MSMTQSMVYSSHSQLPKGGFCWRGEQPLRCSEQWDILVTAPGVMGTAKVTSEVTMRESRPSSAHWVLEQRAACILGHGSPLHRSLVHPWCAQFCFTSWPAQQSGQIHQERGGGREKPLPAPQGLGWPHLWTGGPCWSRHHPHWVTASPSQRGEQPPVRAWLQGALGRAHHSQMSPGRVAFIPSYQCSRGYSCWELSSSAAWGLADEGRRD